VFLILFYILFYNTPTLCCILLFHTHKLTLCNSWRYICILQVYVSNLIFYMCIVLWWFILCGTTYIETTNTKIVCRKLRSDFAVVDPLMHGYRLVVPRGVTISK